MPHKRPCETGEKIEEDQKGTRTNERRMILIEATQTLPKKDLNKLEERFPDLGRRRRGLLSVSVPKVSTYFLKDSILKVTFAPVESFFESDYNHQWIALAKVSFKLDNDRKRYNWNRLYFNLKKLLFLMLILYTTTTTTAANRQRFMPRYQKDEPRNRGERTKASSSYFMHKLMQLIQTKERNKRDKPFLTGAISSAIPSQNYSIDLP